MESIEDYENYKFYLMRSKIVRFIFLRVNHLAELTKYIFEFIPDIPTKSMIDDKSIYSAIGLDKKEIEYINNYFSSATPKRAAKTEKAAKSKHGGRRTRKIRHN